MSFFPGGSEVKASAYNVGDPSSIPGSGRSPGEGNGNPLQYLPGESHERRSLVGYSPRGHKELDTTEWLHFTSLQMCFWNSLAFSMIQQMLAIWSLVPLPFINPAWTSGSSRFTYCWNLAWRFLSITLLACEMNAIVWSFEHSLALPFFGIGMKTDLFQSCGHSWVFQICWHIECSTFTASSLTIKTYQ